MIRRLMVQRASLDWAMGQVARLPGPVLEFGLGNGRSYDHLREHLPNREIFVFAQPVRPHSHSPPLEARLILGAFGAPAPSAAQRFAGQAALIHADVGSGDVAASRALAATLSPHWAAMLAQGGLLVADQP